MNHLEKAKELMNPSNANDRHAWVTNKEEAKIHALIAIAEQLEQIASDMEFAKEKGFNVNIQEDK